MVDALPVIAHAMTFMMASATTYMGQRASGIGKRRPPAFPKEEKHQRVPLKELPEKYPKDYVVVDVHTTGLDPDRHEIIEMVAVDVRNGVIERSFRIVVKPGFPVDWKFMMGLGHLKTETESAPGIHDALQQLLKFIGDAPIVGYNASHSIAFIKTKALKLGITIKNEFVEVLPYVKKRFPRLTRYNIESVARHMGFQFQSGPYPLINSVIQSSVIFIATNAALKLKERLAST